jgi:Signal transduction histidine kinase
MKNDTKKTYKNYRVPNESMFEDSEYMHEQLDRLQFALDAFCAGDMSVRLNKERDDKFSDIADAYNRMAEMAGGIFTEMMRVSRIGGLEGNLDVHIQYAKPTSGIWADVIDSQNTFIQTVSGPVNELNRVLKDMSKGMVNTNFHYHNVSGIWKDLMENINLVTKSLNNQIEEITHITQGVILGDFSRKVTLSTNGEVDILKDTINNLIDFVKTFSMQVARVTKEIGTEGHLGAQVVIPNASGVWKDLVSDINQMSGNLTRQIRDITIVASYVLKGDMSKRVEVETRGEMKELKVTVNNMMEHLELFSYEVNHLLDSLSSEGKLGIRANVPQAAGAWRTFINSINLLMDTMTWQVREINKVSSSLAEGTFNSKIEGDYTGEAFGLKVNINSMVDSFTNLVEAANQIAAGNMDVEMPIRSNKDLLGKALYGMTNNLRRISKENENESWMKTGQSGLGDKMRGEQGVLELSKNIISYLTKYVHGDVGVFYLLEEGEGEPVLKLAASYAYIRRKNISKEFNLGEGLIGQAALEKETIVVSEMEPDDDLRITSGTAVKPPKTIVVQPFILNRKLIGVFEIGSTESFTSHDLNLLKLVSGDIAIAINSAKDRQKMKYLLDESQRQSHELLEQQRRLKEQSDVLKRINKELEVKTSDLEKQKEEVLATRSDIERKAKDLELANKYKSEFLANMSHELRTPLNSLLILAKELGKNNKKNLNDNQVKDLSIIYESGVDLLNLINDILDLSKIEAGRMIANLAEVELQNIVINLENQFTHVARQKNIGFTIKPQEGIGMVITDQQRLEQILKNLLSNAIKFTGQGEVKLNISKSDEPMELRSKMYNPGEVLLFSVIDTGIGIEENKQAMIFEAFQQADGGLSRQYGGTGLGLTISRQIAALLGGEIRLKSQLGEGSEFTLYLPINQTITVGVNSPSVIPLKSADEKPVKEKPAPSVAKASNSEASISPVISSTVTVQDDRDQIKPDDHSILIIEDDHNFADILKKEIHNHGIKTLVTDRGEEGLELASRYLPDGIILDLRLPDMDGMTVLDRLKFKLETRHIPVHVFSVEDEQPEILEKGAIGFLAKPVTQKDIEVAIQKIENIFNSGVKDILVIEDNKVSQQSIVRLLENREVRITTSDTGEEALNLLNQHHFDCIVLDLALPDMTGFDLLKELDKTGIKKIPVIVYTGKELAKEEITELNKYTRSIIIKGAISPERLLDEVSLFLHSLNTNLSEEQQRIVSRLHDPEEVLKERKILIADDDMRNIYALSQKLNDMGMEVFTAENGSVALQMLKENPDIEIVIMDIMMPVMDGLEAIRKLRKQKQFEKLPVISLTAKAMPEDKQQCMAAGASDYLTKPIDMDQLISLIRIWLYKDK